MEKLVIFTGAGVSADSGIGTFRDEDGLWAKYRIEDVCTPEALANNRAVVLEFYNMRRKELLNKEPNAGHHAIKELEKNFEVHVVTQNIDDLHERAGSINILHLHGELRKLRSSVDENLIYQIEGWKHNPEARCEKGSLLRPHVVFFGENVPLFEDAVKIVREADIFIVAGTSLAVYPAASLVRYVRNDIKVYVVDPNSPDLSGIHNEVEIIKMNSVAGLPLLAERLID